MVKSEHGCLFHSGTGKVAIGAVVPPVSTSAGLVPSSGIVTAVSDSSWAVGSLMSLLVPQLELVAAKLPKVWVGDGLPAIPRKLDDKIL